ncbi:MAG: exosortase [Proteobacteria bacterium]|nr:exosortase [Pseudomonadota bacterium]
MTAETISAPTRPTPRPAPWAGLRPALPALAVGIAVWALLFYPEAVAAETVWSESTAYNHGFLILPIVIWLLWDRRTRLIGVVPRPLPLAALAALPVVAVWLLADRLGVMEGRQLMAMTLFQLMVLGVLGWQVYWLLLGPLLYLYFLVPFGAFITPALQNFTTGFVGWGLNLFGIPNYIDRYLIQIPGGAFYVAQACAGLRFLIAAIAFACLYALLIYRSNWRRLIFIAVSLVVPVIANGIRALGIVTLGYLEGSAKAAATDHVLYGWMFFSIVILLLVLIGLPFREDIGGWEPAPRLAPPARPARPLVAAVAVAVVAALGPLLSFGLHRAAAAEVPAGAPFLPAGSCRIVSASLPISPALIAASGGAARVAEQRLSCDGHGVRVVVERFSPRSDPGPILLAERHISGRVGAEDVVQGKLRTDGLTWRIVRTAVPDRTTAFLLWRDGKPRQPALGFRLRQGIASLIGARSVPLLAAISPDPDPTGQGEAGQRQAVTAIRAYLQAQPDLPAALDRLADGGR